MLNRRNGIVALAVVALCGVTAITAVKALDSDAVEPSATSLTGSPIAVTGTHAGSGRAQVDGPEPSAFARPHRATDTPLAAVAHLAQDARRVATVRTLGVDHALYVGKNQSKAKTCLVLQEGLLGRGGGGCNLSRDPFHGSSVLWSSAQYNETPQKLIVFGVVTEGVGAVSLAFADGVSKAVPLTQDDGFIYVVAKPRIEQGDVPRAIVTLDAKGNLIERTALGITFGA